MWLDPRCLARSIRAFRWYLLLLLPVAAAAGGPAADIAIKLPADIVYRGSSNSDSAVVFSHQSHAAFVENHCTTCHPEPFHLLKRGPAPSHAEMNDGRSCGICHDGKKAFDVKDAGMCSTCHAGVRSTQAPAGSSGAGGAAGNSPGAPARKLPGPHLYPSESSPGPVTFRHQSHLQGKGACTDCHPKLFKMAPAPPVPNGGMHDPTACGACHDGSKAFGTQDDASCARCHIETGAKP